MTKTQARIRARMEELAGQGTWARSPRSGMLNLPTVRWTRTQPVPEYAKTGPHPYLSDEYDCHVFLTLVRQIIMRVCPAPWVRCRDSSIPFWLAEAILEDPELALDTQRQLDMRHARRGGRGGDGRR